MKALLLALLLTGCASGNWSDYNYGPGDWLTENTPLQVDTMYNYAHLAQRTVEVHYVDSMEAHCGTMWAQGCAYLQEGHCDIYVGKAASPTIIAHELRHCRGWTHYAPQYEKFSAMGAEFRAREIRRASVWYPIESPASGAALAQARRE
jgi:hypothetical protein